MITRQNNKQKSIKNKRMITKKWEFFSVLKNTLMESFWGCLNISYLHRNFHYKDKTVQSYLYNGNPCLEIQSTYWDSETWPLCNHNHSPNNAPLINVPSFSLGQLAVSFDCTGGSERGDVFDVASESLTKPVGPHATDNGTLAEIRDDFNLMPWVLSPEFRINFN